MEQQKLFGGEFVFQIFFFNIAILVSWFPNLFMV